MTIRALFMAFPTSPGIVEAAAERREEAHDDTATAAVMQVDVVATLQPCSTAGPYIRRTLGCRRRKQGLPPPLTPPQCAEPFPSLALNHAAHNKSRQ